MPRLKSLPTFSQGYLRAIPPGGLPELVEFFDGGGKIGIGEQRPLCAAFQHAVPDGVTLAPVARIAQHAQRRVRGAHLFGCLHGAVRRPIVHHQNLGKLPGAARQISHYLAQGIGEPLLFVVGWNDNRD
jgi:hypothetical protein